MLTIQKLPLCSKGAPVAITLENSNHMRVTLLSYGATIQSIVVPDRNGVLTDVLLGYETVKEYEENDGYLTALYACNTLLQVFYFPFRTTVLFVNIVGELFDAKHVAMVGYGNPLHSILHRFVHQAAHAGLTIEKRILGMDV